MSSATESHDGDLSSPDPLRLGGFGWALRTGGRLTVRERGRLLSAIALGQRENAIGRAKLALGRLPPGAANVDLDTCMAPDSLFAREAEQACAELPASLVGAALFASTFLAAVSSFGGPAAVYWATGTGLTTGHLLSGLTCAAPFAGAGLVVYWLIARRASRPLTE